MGMTGKISLMGLDQDADIQRELAECSTRFGNNLLDAVKAFDLVLNVIDRTGRVQAIQIVVPLVIPSEVDDDELEYESSVVARFDPSLVSDPKKLRVRAEVVPRGGGVVLDHDETSVKYRH